MIQIYYYLIFTLLILHINIFAASLPPLPDQEPQTSPVPQLSVTDNATTLPPLPPSIPQTNIDAVVTKPVISDPSLNNNTGLEKHSTDNNTAPAGNSNESQNVDIPKPAPPQSLKNERKNTNLELPDDLMKNLDIDNLPNNNPPQISPAVSNKSNNNSSNINNEQSSVALPTEPIMPLLPSNDMNLELPNLPPVAKPIDSVNIEKNIGDIPGKLPSINTHDATLPADTIKHATTIDVPESLVTSEMITTALTSSDDLNLLPLKHKIDESNVKAAQTTNIIKNPHSSQPQIPLHIDNSNKSQSRILPSATTTKLPISKVKISELPDREFINNELAILESSEEDAVELGVVQQNELLDLMDDLQYINLFLVKLNEFNNLNKQQRIDRFIANNRKFYGSDIFPAIKYNNQLQNQAIEAPLYYHDLTQITYQAIKANDLSTLRIFIDNYPILRNMKDEDDNNLLAIAVLNNNKLLTAYFLEKNLDYNHKNKYAQTALDLAIAHQYTDIINLLTNSIAKSRNFTKFRK